MQRGTEDGRSVTQDHHALQGAGGAGGGGGITQDQHATCLRACVGVCVCVCGGGGSMEGGGLSCKSCMPRVSMPCFFWGVGAYHAGAACHEVMGRVGVTHLDDLDGGRGPGCGMQLVHRHPTISSSKWGQQASIRIRIHVRISSMWGQQAGPTLLRLLSLLPDT